MIRRQSRSIQSTGGTVKVPLFVWACSVIRHSVFVIVFSPLFVFGHACEFLVARLEVKPERVILEITADYGGNPLIEDEAAARDAVKRILEVHLGGEVRRLEDLEPLKFEKRIQWDPDPPTAFSPPPDGTEHQLLTGIWSWPPHARTISLAVPKGNHHDVLLWTKDENLPGKQAKWMLLIEGESTAEIQVIPTPEPPHRPFSTGVHWLTLGLTTWGLWRFLKQRRKGMAPPPSA